MNFRQYITNDYKPLSLHTTVREVKEMFKNLPFTHFAVVEEQKFIGMLAQSNIMNLPKDDIILQNITHFFEFYQGNTETNCLDLLSLFAQYDTDIIPVTDENQHYTGYFELDDIIRLFYKTPFLTSNATTLIIEKTTTQLSMSEVAQIIESNNVDLLGMYVSDRNEENTQITLRIEIEHLNEVLQSLRRYEYKVLTDNEADLLLEQMKERSLYLQKFYDL